MAFFLGEAKRPNADLLCSLVMYDGMCRLRRPHSGLRRYLPWSDATVESELSAEARRPCHTSSRNKPVQKKKKAIITAFEHNAFYMELGNAAHTALIHP